MFSDKDKSDFTRTERVLGDVKDGYATRGKYGIGRQFIRWVAKEGLDKPAFTNVGRWRSDDAASHGGSVYIPWLTIDIDNVDLVQAYEDSVRTIDRLEELGYDLERIVCSFSGNKGFHIQVDSTQMGLAPFQGPKHARLLSRTWTEDVCMDSYFDPSVCTPRSLLRVTGSTHEKSGLHKRSFFAEEFRRRGLDGVMRNVRDAYEPFDWPEGGGILPQPREHLRDLYERAERNYRGRRSSGAYASATKNGSGVLDNIRYGIREGQEFGPRNFHVGRENAAFVMGCKLLEECDTQRTAHEKLRQWNGLNNPPLRHSRLEAQWRGAKRKMNKSRR
jgi:hypothetical protein